MPHRLLALCIFVLSLLASCQTGGAQTMLVGFADAGDELAVRFDVDTQTMFAIANVDARGGLYSKFSQSPILFGEWKAGEVRVTSKKLQFDQTFKPGDPLPFWLNDIGIFLPGDVDRWGLVFTQAPGP